MELRIIICDPIISACITSDPEQGHVVSKEEFDEYTQVISYRNLWTTSHM